MAATTQIINNGASLKIVSADGTRNILKQQIREVSPLADGVVKIDIGQGSLNNIFINHSEVSEPVTPSAEALADTINTMLQTNLGGIATEANQNSEINELKNIKTNQLFTEPKLCDETNALSVYRGFGAPGSRTSDPVWAIQKTVKINGVVTQLWAGGNRNFDKVWDNRKTIQYS
jgi:hypothetical protein